MALFTDSTAVIIDNPSVSTNIQEDKATANLIDINSETQVSFMGAKTQPIQDGTSISVDATIEKTNNHELTYTHPKLGWCVNFVPPDGVLAQMAQLQEFRESFPTDASDLCMKCEQMIKIATIGELNEFREVCGSVIGISSWAKPPPLW